ncbi:hypothetical protein BJ944DRAFT_242615 [Cunninghamella echinulata]|nr:hypothetical protein BJ944DRAFT_242615 [Cunninghamella echinulata]
MNKLSCQLIEHIFSFLSQRYLHHVSLVCEKWLHITRQPKFYKSVELCSTSQIEKFIEFIQAVAIKDTPLSHYIKKIIFYDQFIHNLKPYRLVALINLCPFVTHVDNIPDIGEENYKVLSDTNYWRHLKSLPLSYTKIDKRWMDHMKKVNNDKYKVVSLSIDASQYTVAYTKEYSNIVTDNERNYRLLKVEDQRDLVSSRRYNDYNRSMLFLVYFNSYYLKLPSSLVNLKKLHLDFETYNKRHSLCYYEFNESTLDSISTSCPSLTYLTLSEFNFNISHDLLDEPDATHQYWPHTKLLAWSITHPNQLTTFRYPFDLFTIERGNNDWEAELAIKNIYTGGQRRQRLPQCRNYLQDLKTLELNFDLIPENTLQYLLYQNPSKHVVQPPLFHEYHFVNPHQNLQQKLSPCYQLTELNLKNCHACLDLSEMTRFLGTLGNLHSLYIDGAWFTTKPAPDILTISAPHLNLCNLQLSNLKCDYFNPRREPLVAEYKYYDIKAKAKETSSKKSFTVQRDPSNIYKYISNSIFYFECSSVDNFWA